MTGIVFDVFSDAERKQRQAVLKFNPNHDERGRFASGDSSGDAPVLDTSEAQTAFLQSMPEAFSNRQAAFRGEPLHYSTVEQKALVDYKGVEYETINKFLRDRPAIEQLARNMGAPEEIVRMDAQVKSLDDAMAKTTTPSAVVVVRSFNEDKAGGRLKSGTTFKEPAYSSSSLRQDWQASVWEGKSAWLGGARTRVEITVPAGTHAVALDNKAANPYGQKTEAELLIDRGAHYHVDRRGPGSNGIPTLFLTLLSTNQSRRKTSKFATGGPMPDAFYLVGELGKFNPNHDEKGRFSSGDGGAVVDPQADKLLPMPVTAAFPHGGQHTHDTPGGKIEHDHPLGKHDLDAPWVNHPTDPMPLDEHGWGGVPHSHWAETPGEVYVHSHDNGAHAPDDQSGAPLPDAYAYGGRFLPLEEEQAFPLTGYEHLSAEYYKGSGYGAINTGLRMGYITAARMAEEGGRMGSLSYHIKNIDSAFSRAKPLAEDTTVYRSLSEAKSGLNPNTKQFVDKGYSSTSLQRESQESSSSRALAVITVPKGTKVIALDKVMDMAEHELLLPRNARYRIHKVDDVSQLYGRKNNIYTMTYEGTND